MPRVKTDRVLMALLVVCLGLLAWAIAGAFRENVVVAGDTAPHFAITTDSGRTITPRDFGGKLLVLHFWASWCPPCVVEMPSLNQFQKEFAGAGVVVLGVSVDHNPKAYQAFLRRMGVSFLTARDPEARISYQYGAYQYPETFIINREGKVVEKIISNTDWMDPERLSVIRALLSS
jgi:cytochrome c biogenesis protein CcmG, thiol:disulfide interchange protein DsbE